MIRKLAIFILLSFIIQIHSIESLNYNIVYLGINLAKVKMIHQPLKKIINVTSNSTGFASELQKVDNNYFVEYKDHFLPSIYKKHIIQKKFFENLTMEYSHNRLFASVIDSVRNEEREYHILPETRDFFSALYYLRFTTKKKGEIFLDAREINWKITFKFEGKETVILNEGEYQTEKVKLNFEKLSEKKPMKSDMLTNNLVNEKNTLYFWFSTDSKRIPIKARYKMLPFSVWWELDNYEEYE